MDRPRERAFRWPAIDDQQNPPKFVAPAPRSSKVGLSGIYRAMRRIGGYLDEERYYEKLWIL